MASRPMRSNRNAASDTARRVLERMQGQLAPICDPVRRGPAREARRTPRTEWLRRLAADRKPAFFASFLELSRGSAFRFVVPWSAIRPPSAEACGQSVQSGRALRKTAGSMLATRPEDHQADEHLHGKRKVRVEIGLEGGRTARARHRAAAGRLITGMASRTPDGEHLRAKAYDDVAASTWSSNHPRVVPPGSRRSARGLPVESRREEKQFRPVSWDKTRSTPLSAWLLDRSSRRTNSRPAAPNLGRDIESFERERDGESRADSDHGLGENPARQPQAVGFGADTAGQNPRRHIVSASANTILGHQAPTSCPGCGTNINTPSMRLKHSRKPNRRRAGSGDLTGHSGSSPRASPSYRSSCG